MLEGAPYNNIEGQRQKHYAKRHGERTGRIRRSSVIFLEDPDVMPVPGMRANDLWK